MKLISLIVIVLINCIGVNGQVVQFGSCGDVKKQEYFRIDKFVGIWNEIERFSSWYENEGQCAYKDFKCCGDDVTIEHVHILNGIKYVMDFKSVYKAGDEAIFHLEQSNLDPLGVSISIVSTDYDNYAVAYGCKNDTSFDLRYVSAWILSREKIMDDKYLSMTHEILSSLTGASVAYLNKVDQEETHCQYTMTAHIESEFISHEENLN